MMWAWMFLSAWMIQAAPFPGTGSSSLLSTKPGFFQSSKGFQLDGSATTWSQISPPKHIPSLVTIYKAPAVAQGQQAALTVRVDQLKQTQALRQYIKRWMQDYSRFGFDVLTAKPIRINQHSAFLLDIISKETQKQLRQVVFIKEKLAVILTCRDERQTFAKTVQECNEIIKTFQWTEAD